MNQDTYTKKRNQWLEEVSDNCHEFALQCDTDFYVFQTPTNVFNPELLIIGINPGGGTPYSDLLKQKGYEKRPSTDLGYDVNTLTTKPEWESSKGGSNVMRDRLSRVFSGENQLQETLENAVMMNMFYFNTATEKDLNTISAEAKGYCLNKTLEFIEILNPKNILFLASEANLKKYVSSIKMIENNVKKGILNNRYVFIIPHYGYFGAWSLVKGAAMGKTLRALLK